jgi:hypothetical protein
MLAEMDSSENVLMKLNPILVEMSDVEKQFYEWYKETSPSSAYTEGVNECAGKFFIPSKQNLRNAEEKLETIIKQAQNRDQRRLFKSYLTGLRFNEPYMVPSGATNAFFTHLVKEGIVLEHLLSLAKLVEEALDAFTELLAKKEWSTEIKVVTCQLSDQLSGILDTIIAEAKDENLKKALANLRQRTLKYRKLYEVEGIKQGDFSEIFPILKKTRGKVKHKAIYPRLIADFWGYPESPQEIERKAKLWLKKELPILRKVTKSLAKIYGVKPDVEAVDKELNKRRGIPKEQALEFVKKTRTLAQKVFEKNIVGITPKYKTKVIETPSYLVNMIPTAAMGPFDGFTDEPFNIFFVTTNPRFSPSSNVPDLITSLLHEEYGHAVNFSNSVTRYAAGPTFLEILSSSPFSTHISDGISFHREYEFVELLKKLVKTKAPSDEEAEFLKILKGENDAQTMLLENEFTMQEWRIMRFLRAIFDVRINMEKQSIADFVEWAHRETGLSEKMIYNQTWIFLEAVGYAPCYSIAGDKISKLQQQALKKGISLLNFNTFVSSLGFPPWKTFEKRIQQYIAKTKKASKSGKIKR